MTGWISIHRKITENPLWLSEPFTRAQAWIDLLILSNHKDGFIYVRGNKIDVKRGQVGWSVQKLSKRWRWSVGKTNRFLNELETEGQIDRQKNRVSSVISIVKYDEYQINETQTDRQTVRQTGEQIDIQTGIQTEHRQSTNNNDNNDNKKKSHSPLSKFIKDFPEITLTTKVRGEGKISPAQLKTIILSVLKSCKKGEDEARWYYNRIDDAGYLNQKGFPLKVGEMIEDIQDLNRRGWIKTMTESEFREVNG